MNTSVATEKKVVVKEPDINYGYEVLYIGHIPPSSDILLEEFGTTDVVKIKKFINDNPDWKPSWAK